MRHWESIREIAEYCELEPSASLEEIKSKIRALLKEVHPDNTGGAFQSDAQREKFDHLKSALTYLGSTSIVPVEIRDLIQVVQKQNALMMTEIADSKRELAKQTASDKLIRLKEETSKSLERNIKKQYFSSKMLGGGLASVGIFFVAVSEPLKEIFGSIKPVDPNFSITISLLAALLVISGAVFTLLSFYLEAHAKTLREKMLSERTFIDFINSPEFYKYLEHNEDDSAWRTRATLAGITNSVSMYERHLDANSCEEIAVLIMERLINRDLASRMPGPFISPVLRLDKNFSEEIGLQDYRK